jgi:hypothetical protein
MPSQSVPAKDLVLSGSCGGFSAALNLLDICNGKPARTTIHIPAIGGAIKCVVPIQIKIVDERDGYCKSLTLMI